MPPPVRNLVNLSSVAIGYSGRPILTGVTLGVGEGERIGVVGRNGDGKSTLMRLIAGIEEPDSGGVTRTGGVSMEHVGQSDRLDPAKTIRQELVGDRADHEWAGDAAFRDVLDGLLGGVSLARFPDGIDTLIGPLSGGERRRIDLARALLTRPELLLLDEPTNHLDVEGVQWLAGHLAARRGTLVVITHDRWFLDAVCQYTWEVEGGAVHQYEGGYAAYVLAKAERERQSAARESKRQQLIRKELAWLRRGPPARTSKPKFRVEAATALISDEPEPRNSVELLRFAATRLGKQVLDAVGVSLAYGDKVLLRGATWRIGPGDRVALVGVNGSGKSSLLRILAGVTEPSTGEVTRGQTVRLAFLSQEAAEIDGDLRVLESLEQVRGRITTSTGEELTAGVLCERFGFRGGRQRALVRELSGGERRRLQMMRLLMEEPNVLLLDEPTNDLDIETLTALEDLLDTWPGTIIVVSHDRYFVERVCDDVYALSPDGQVRHLARGIEQYLAERGEHSGSVPAPAPPGQERGAGAGDPAPSGAERRAARKELQRIERALERAGPRADELQAQMAAAASDPERLRVLTEELTQLRAEQGRLEEAWLEAGEVAGD